MMMNSRLAMNGVCPMMSPVCGSRRGAPGGRVHSATTASTPSSARPALRRPRESSAGSTSSATTGPASPASMGLYLPRRGSTTFTVMNPATIVITMVETIWKK